MSPRVTDSDLVALADKPDWWMPSWRTPEFKLSLRAAIDEALALPDMERAFLFRAGGSDEGAVWLKGDDIRRLSALLSSETTSAELQVRRA